MKIADWRPTKYIRNKKGQLVASHEKPYVWPTSWLIADLTAAWYDIHLKKFARGKLLDLGCGQAPLYGTYAPLVDDIVLADWENAPYDDQHVDVHCDIADKLPFKDNSFDTVLLSDVLEHIPYPKSAMQEVARILKPNGCVLINVPFYYWLHQTPYDYNRYTEFMLKLLAEDAGLSVVKLEALGGGYAVLIDLLSRLWLGRRAMIIQTILPRLLAKKLKARTEIPLAYAMVCKKAA